MTTYSHRIRVNANASIISMVQRFSDIAIIFLGLYLSSLINKVNFGYNQVLMFLLALVVFQMIGGITDFYRSWRGVKIS
ncbi:undecaprenyl-phosphate glucose phosphotransferase, partial [Klebsiella pneumoniae]|nr:undecaprenyl-phosphate glucose phosphotransferase [Klebsiella pneumoniae]